MAKKDEKEAEFDFRNVQETSSGTFLISLPKKWCKEHNITKKDELIIRYSGVGSLMIYPAEDKATERRSITIVNKDLDKTLRMVLQRYLEGYNIIRIIDIERDSKEKIRKQARELIGIEVLKETQNQMELHFIVGSKAIDPRKYLQREFAIALDMMNDAITLFLEKDTQNIASISNRAKEIELRDIEVNRIFFFIVRLLKTILNYPTPKSPFNQLDECLSFRIVASYAEEIGDKAKGLAFIAIDYIQTREDIRKESINNQLRSAKRALSFVSQSLEAFIGKDVSHGQTIKNEIEKEIQDNGTLFGIEKSYSILEVHQITNRLNEIAIDICDLII